MAGNSRRRGAIRKSGTKKGPTVGSGGQRRRGLEGRGPTPPAHMRPNHPAARRTQSQSRRPAKRTDETEMVLGRNPVLECLRADVPATALYVALGTEADERLTESVARAADLGIAILEVPRADLDRMTSNHLHQGIALQVPPYDYAHPDDLLAAATTGSSPALVVALDNISDPRNLGAIVRSVAAFGGHGVLIPQRRSASVTAVAWRTSAGAAARIPVARATNLTRALKHWADSGLRVIGLDAGGDTALDELDGTDPLVVVVGSEGKGLSRLVRQTCDEVVSIPMADQAESLNASVAAGVVLAEIARQRRR
jgi:23S rRNA (guanosine2251-2'-O)-methyltransferase